MTTRARHLRGTVGRLVRIASRPRRAITELKLWYLETRPRHRPGSVRLDARAISYVDGPSLASAYRAIFLDRIYDLPAGLARPTIIDGGANIGLACLRWLDLHPSARLIAYEADPRIAAVARENTAAHPAVEVVSSALWIEEGEVTFHVEGADAGRIDAGQSGAAPSVTVGAVRLADVLADVGRVDLLKLDVEGAEVDLVLDAKDSLAAVDRVFVEFHSFVARDQRLDELLAVLRAAGFRTFVQSEFVSPRPFSLSVEDAGMDLRVNIFAVRPACAPDQRVNDPVSSTKSSR